MASILKWNEMFILLCILFYFLIISIDAIKFYFGRNNRTSRGATAGPKFWSPLRFYRYLTIKNALIKKGVYPKWLNSEAKKAWNSATEQVQG